MSTGVAIVDTIILALSFEAEVYVLNLSALYRHLVVYPSTFASEPKHKWDDDIIRDLDSTFGDFTGAEEPEKTRFSVRERY